MLHVSESVTSNKLLATLSQRGLALLAPHLQGVDLPLGKVLSEANQPMEHAYFPTSGICSVIADNIQGVRIEFGVIGREGFVGLPLVLYAKSAPSKVIVQASGRALRISRTKLQNTMKHSQSLAATLLRFVHVFHVQVSQTGLSNGHYTIIERLARWLLMCQDRVGEPEFPMTHQMLSHMLAVRRSGVTDALKVLEARQTIRALRGRIIILDRAGLVDIAGGAYGVPEQEYDKVFPRRESALENGLGVLKLAQPDTMIHL